jgi:hypothetical protein
VNFEQTSGRNFENYGRERGEEVQLSHLLNFVSFCATLILMVKSRYSVRADAPVVLTLKNALLNTTRKMKTSMLPSGPDATTPSRERYGGRGKIKEVIVKVYLPQGERRRRWGEREVR